MFQNVALSRLAVARPSRVARVHYLSRSPRARWSSALGAPLLPAVLARDHLDLRERVARGLVERDAASRRAILRGALDRFADHGRAAADALCEAQPPRLATLEFAGLQHQRAVVMQ